MFAVTGTPRSATGYASMLFEALNVPCTHESLFRPRTALADVLTWYAGRERQPADSSFLAWVFLPLMPGPVKVLHCLRNPWAVIDSLTNRNDLLAKEARIDRGRQQIRDALQAYCPEAFESEDTLTRAAVLAVQWNRRIRTMCESCAHDYLCYRVEELDKRGVRRILDFLGIFRDEVEIEQALADTPRNVNGGKRIEYNVEITNPDLRRIICTVMPDLKSPVIERAVSADTPRSSEILSAAMPSDVAESVRQLCRDYGYPETFDPQHPRQEAEHAGHECALV